MKKQLKKLLKPVDGVLRSTALFRSVATATLSLPGSKSKRHGHVLLAPPGAGNIGDSALVESFLESVDERVTVVVRSKSNFTLDQQNVHVVEMPHLLYGRLPWAIRDLVRLSRLLDRSTSFSVVGADIMDGAYNPRASARRAILSRLALRRDTSSRVLGFSWNASPEAGALREVRAASQAGVQLLLRDPASARRAVKDNLSNVTSCADMVFTAKTVDPDAKKKYLAHVGDAPFALLNVSGLLRQSQDLTEDYIAVIEHLRVLGYHVVLLPHVVKPGSSDLDAVDAVAQRLVDQTNVTTIRETLRPAEVRGLTKNAKVVITGRMHLAVMSLMAGLAPVTLASQGKVQGLFELFEREYLCVQPKPGMKDAIIEALSRALDDGPIDQERLAKVTNLAELNFAGLQSEGSSTP